MSITLCINYSCVLGMVLEKRGLLVDHNHIHYVGIFPHQPTPPVATRRGFLYTFHLVPAITLQGLICNMKDSPWRVIRGTSRISCTGTLRPKYPYPHANPLD